MTSRHLSTLALHQLRYGELASPMLADANAHIASCPHCSSRLAAQQRQRAEFVLLPMPNTIRRLTPAGRPWWQDLVPLIAALAAAAVLFALIPAVRTTGVAEDHQVIAFRGELPAIEAWVDQGSGRRPLRDGEALGQGDRVQLAYDPRNAASIALAGRDDTGLIEVYTTKAPSGTGLVTAPFSLTLDDAPGVQELFVLRSERSLDALMVKAAITVGVPGVTVLRLAIEKKRTGR